MTKWTHIKALIALAVLLSFSACTTTTPEPAADDSVADVETAPPPPAPPSGAGWILISENPSTFFPKSMPKDAATDHLNGEWVHSGDRSAKWFVPKGGIGTRTEKELQTEALSMRTQADEAPQENRVSATKKSWDSLLRPLARTTATDVEE